MNILFLSHLLPWPPRGGGAIKRFRLVERLAARHDLSLVALGSDDDAMAAEGLRSRVALRHFRLFPGRKPRTALTLLRSYARGVPLSVYRNLHAGCLDHVASIAHDFDALFLDSILMSPCVPRGYAGRIILHAHNAEHRIWEGLAAIEENPLVRIAVALEARRLRRFEAAAICRAHVVLAARDDIPRLRALAVPREVFLETMHLGDEGLLERPRPEFDETAEELLSVGTLGWEPNADGLLWFLKRVWPLLRRSRPGLSFTIAGEGCPPTLARVAEAAGGVRLAAFVEDLEPLYRRARVFLAPLRFGSGMKVKVIEAMYRGVPVATTPVGIESVSVTPGVHAAVAGDPDGLAREIEALLADRVRWESVRDASRERMRRCHTWEHAFAPLDRALAGPD